jgi:hypothetical protein
MRLFVLVGLLAAAVALSGCAYYRLADRNAPSAKFRFNYAGGSSQYSVVKDDPCEKGARLAKFGAFDSAKRNVMIAAGKAVRIKARTLFSTWGSSGSKLNWCESVAEFSPQNGHSYRVRHYQPEGRQCILKLEDEADNTAPPDLVIQDALTCPPIRFSW